jgi:predicted Zn-dependent peptidase
MDLQALYWLVAVLGAALGGVSLLRTQGHKEGATDAQIAMQVAHLEAAEKSWSTKFDALYASFSLHQAQTAERFERVLERLNDALLTMAREHPTKADLQQVKGEILDRIDSQYGEPEGTVRRRRVKPKD